MNWNSLSIRTKLTLIFGSLATIAMLAAAITFISFNQINSIRAKILDLHLADKSRITADNNFLLFRQNPDSKSLNKLFVSISEVKSILQELRATPLQQSDIGILNEILTNIELYNKSIETLSLIDSRRIRLSAEASAITNEISNSFPEYTGEVYKARYLGQRFIISSQKSDFTLWEQAVTDIVNKAREIENNDLVAKVNSYLTVGQNFWKAIEETATVYAGIANVEIQTGASLEQLLANSEGVFNIQRSKNIRFIISVLLILIISSGIVSFMYSKNLSSSLKRGIQFAEIVSSGDLSVQFDKDILDKKDEIGELARSLNNMGEKLKGITKSIISGSESISSASIEFSNTSQQISKGANEQASSTEEISSSMEQMAANIDQNSSNSKEAERVANETEKGVIDGVNAAAQALDFVNQISEKITIIRDISFQTNILALNAAVEAARAGEHGKGFAVVAAEVRKLAERSSVSAQDIENMAFSLKGASDTANQKLNAVIPKVKDNLKLIQEISAASNEQASGAEQVNNAIQHLNQIVQENASSSEELASNAEEIKKLALNLIEEISFFKVDDVKVNKQSFKGLPKQIETKVGNKKIEPKSPIKRTYVDGFEIKMSGKESDSEYTSF